MMVVLFSLLLAACNDTELPSNDQQASGHMPVEVLNPLQRDVLEWDEYVGRFEASQRVDIRAQVSGYLKEIKFTDGQLVEKDDVLFVIDKRPFEIAVTDAQAQYELAKHRFERAEALSERQVISADHFEQRSQEMRSALASLQRAQLALEHTEVRAPISGRIGRKLFDPGSLVVGGINAVVLTTIVNVHPIHLYADATENMVLKRVRQVGEGRRNVEQAAPWRVEAKLIDEETYQHQGVVDFVDNEYSQETGTITFRALFENTDGLLEAGMFARMRIATPYPLKALLIPDRVIGTEQTRKFVYIINPDGLAARKYIELGGLEEGDLRVVKSGLNPSDQIITANLNLVRPGVPVAASSTEY